MKVELSLGSNSLRVEGDFALNGGGFPELVNVWLAAQDAPDGSALEELTNTLAANTDTLAQAVASTTIP